jgi:hypothetical protein
LRHGVGCPLGLGREGGEGGGPRGKGVTEEGHLHGGMMMSSPRRLIMFFVVAAATGCLYLSHSRTHTSMHPSEIPQVLTRPHKQLTPSLSPPHPQQPSRSRRRATRPSSRCAAASTSTPCASPTATRPTSSSRACPRDSRCRRSNRVMGC